MIERSLGGQIIEDEKGYLVGCPELVLEIASSTLAADLEVKAPGYEAGGAREYAVVDLGHRMLHWCHRRSGRCLSLGGRPDGVLRSLAVPRLWLDPRAYLQGGSRMVGEGLRQGLATEEHA